MKKWREKCKRSQERRWCKSIINTGKRINISIIESFIENKGLFILN